LLKGVCGADPGITARIAAITDRGSCYAYPRQVRWEIEQDDNASYAAAGRALSRAKVGLVSLQHEFGLWGDAGDLATAFDQYDCAPAFLDALDRPVVTTLHTVLSKPRADLRAAIRLLCVRSAATVVMVGVGAKILAEDYDVDPTRLVVIPHGVPEVRAVDKERIKHQLRLSGHTIVSTCGLLTRNKGIETAIRALPEVVARHPDVLYLIMGETHPQVRKREGEAYREELAALAHALNVSCHVRFMNQYLAQQSLVHYLQGTDVYVTPYHDRDQITSGTLAYALSCACASVSTPYVYATEALAEGRGLLAEFDNPESIARCVNLYLDDPMFRHHTEERAFAYGQQRAWSHVGARYAALFRHVAHA
jgi:glycosyltransferase involved in cell wall biosynthesis